MNQANAKPRKTIVVAAWAQADCAMPLSRCDDLRQINVHFGRFPRRCDRP
jgi:hypothetical protein